MAIFIAHQRTFSHHLVTQLPFVSYQVLINWGQSPTLASELGTLSFIPYDHYSLLTETQLASVALPFRLNIVYSELKQLFLESILVVSVSASLLAWVWSVA